MTDTVSTPPSRDSVALQASWWWSRHDDLANRQLSDILTRHGHPCADITAPDAVDASLRAAVQNDDALTDLAEWVAMIAARRGGSGIRNLQHNLGRLTAYLAWRVGEKPLTATTLQDCRQQIGFIDGTIREGRDLPELAYPDDEMTELLRRYNKVRGVVLAAEPTQA